MSDGTYSTVYAGETASRARCAIKVFKTNRSSDEEPRSKASRFFLRELDVLCNTSHPNLIRLLDFGQSLDRIEDFLALEWVEGCDFVSASKNASKHHFYSMLVQVCRALEHLHVRGFVHGDLKPQNLLVSQDPNSKEGPPLVKLLDFSYTTSVGSLPINGVEGSPQYLAPEVIEGKPTTHTSDLYALGTVLYESLSGAPPFFGMAIGSMLRQQVHDLPPPIPTHSLNEIQPLIFQLLSKDPSRRLRSAADVLRWLRTVPVEGDLRLHTPDTLLDAARTLPNLVSPQRINEIKQFLTASLNKRPLSTTQTILIWGDKGAGKTRNLQELALHARDSGYSVHTFTRPSMESIQTLSAPSTSQDSISNGRVPVLIALDDVDHQHLPALAAIIASPPQTLHPTIYAITLDRAYSLATNSSELLQDLNRRLPSLHVHLEPLNVDNVTTLLYAFSGIANIQPGLAASLHQETGGNPALLVHLMAYCVDKGIITIHNGTLLTQIDLRAMVLPDNITARLQEVCASIPDSDLNIAILVAAANDSLMLCDIELLTALVPSEVLRCCHGLLYRGVLRTAPASSTTYSISSAMLGRAILNRLPIARRNSVYRHLADWYLTSSGRQDSLERAAACYFLAGACERAVIYCLRAAMQAERRGDPRTAHRFFQYTLEADPDDPHIRARACLGLVAALQSLGRLREATTLLTGLRNQDALPSVLRSQVNIRCAAAAGMSGDYVLMEQLARLGVNTTPGSDLSLEFTEAMCQLGVALCRLERRDEGIPLLFRSLRLSRKLHNESIRMEALTEIAACHWKIGDFKRALNYQRRSLHLRVQNAGDSQKVTGLVSVGVLRADLGHYSSARKVHHQAYQHFSEKGIRRGEATALNNIAETYRAQGRFRAALGWYLKGKEILRESGAELISMTIDYNLALLFTKTGYHRESSLLLKHTLQRARTMGWAQVSCGASMSWGWLLTMTGRPEHAMRLLMHASRLAEEAGLWSSLLELRTLYALALSSVGNPKEGREVLSEATARGEARSPFEARISAQLASAEIDRALGLSSEAADDRLKPIINTARGKRMAWHLTGSLMLRAEVLLSAGRTEEAQKDLDEAIEVAQKNADRPQFWQASYWLGRVFEQRLQYEQALGCYRVAALTINELAMDLDDERYREPFLAQPAVREAQARYERLRAEVGRKARHDIAAMSRSEKISRRMLNALNTIGQKLTSILDLNELLAHLLDLSVENVRAERGMVFLRDEATDEMQLACARNMDKQSLEDVSTFSRSVIKRVAEGHTLLEVDVGKDPALSVYKSLVIHEIKSILCVPMRTRGKTIGVIYLDTRRAAQMFTDKERTFVESFASQAAIAIENARLFGDINAENVRLKQEVAGRSRFENMIGMSPAMQKMTDVISSVASSDCNVFIVGESGTGKELVARAIHFGGPRQKRKFIAIDCGALPESLLEAELFGFARGAFTGADRDKIGLIEEAHGGTLFLDEISNTSVALQARLLRVLQEHEVRRLGENAARRVDIRVVAATNGDVVHLMQEGKFRSDLYYRLNVVTIEVPPLRDRREDIPLLVEHFLKQRTADGTASKRLAPGVVDALCRYEWPGNVRELENVVERLVVLTPGTVVTQDRVPDEIRAAAGFPPTRTNGDGYRHKTGEQLMVEQTLRRFQGDKAKTARFIGWNRQKLYRKMKIFGIPADYGQRV